MLGLRRAPSALPLSSHSAAPECALFASEKGLPLFSPPLDLTIKARYLVKQWQQGRHSAILLQKFGEL